MVILNFCVENLVVQNKNLTFTLNLKHSSGVYTMNRNGMMNKAQVLLTLLSRHYSQYSLKFIIFSKRHCVKKRKI